LEKYPTNAIVYRHGEVNPGAFLSFRGTSYYIHSIVQVFSDGLLLKLLTCGFTKPKWTILDGAAAIPTGTPVVNMVVLTSPGQQTDSLKGLKYAIPIVNPPWSLEDIERVRRGVFQEHFAHLTQEFVAKAYAQWGGIPRILFDLTTAKNSVQLHRNLTDSIYMADLNKLFDHVRLSSVNHDSVSRLHFHLVPGENIPSNIDVSDKDATFQYPAYCWASTCQLKNRFLGRTY
jgi:hypothetical protein